MQSIRAAFVFGMEERPWGRVPACAPRPSARSLRWCRDGSRNRDLSLLQAPPGCPEQGQLQAGPQDAALAALHRALVSGERSVVLELCVLCWEGALGHAGGVGLHLCSARWCVCLGACVVY